MDRQTRVTIAGHVTLTGAEQVRQQAEQVRRTQEALEEAASSTGSAMDEAMDASLQATQALNNELGRIPELLRNAFNALRSNQPTQAAGFQTEAARLAFQHGDESSFNTATMLNRAIRLAGTADNGNASRQRYEEALRALEQRVMTPAGGDTAGAGGVLLNPEVAIGRAARTLTGVEASLAGGVNRTSQLTELEQRLGRAGAYIQQAGRAGAEDEQIRQLNEHLESLTSALEETRDSFRSAGGGAGGGGGAAPPPTPPDDQGGGMPSWAQNLFGGFTSFGRGGLAGLGLGGRFLAGLGMPGIAAGAVIGGYTLADHMVSGSNRAARDEMMGMTDLARQYGYDQDPFTFFRQGSGWSNEDLIKMGYTGTDAGRVASLYNLPGGFRGDTKDILTFARTTGLDEGNSAQLARSLGLAGSFERGGAGQALETLKLAMAEGLKLGVSQSDTIKNIQQTIDANYREGRQSSATALAFTASMQNVLAQTGNRTLQGDMGMGAQQGLMNAVTGAGDPGLEMLLINRMGSMSADQLGLTGSAAAGYEALRQRDGYAAGRQALGLLKDGRNPEMLAKLAGSLESAFGNDPYLMSLLLEQAGLQGEQVLSGIQNFSNFFGNAAAGTGAYQDGADLAGDVQGANDVNNATLKMNALTNDMGIRRSVASLNLTGDLETLLKQLGIDATEGMAIIQDWFSGGSGEGYMGQGGSLRGGVGGNGGGVTMPGQPKGAVNGGFTPNNQRFSADGWGLGLFSGLGATAITMDPGQPYGPDVPSLWGQAHKGVDLRIGEAGQPDSINNPFGRVKVSKAGYSDSYGNYADYETEEGLKFRIAHLNESMKALEGEWLEKGTPLGTEGNTGLSTGYHAHFELLSKKAANFRPDSFMDEFMKLFNAPGPEGSAREQKITVVFEGLDNITVTGVTDPTVAEGIRAGSQLIGDAIRVPLSRPGV
jgi:hypothetical protein